MHPLTLQMSIGMPSLLHIISLLVMWGLLASTLIAMRDAVLGKQVRVRAQPAFASARPMFKVAQPSFKAGATSFRVAASSVSAAKPSRAAPKPAAVAANPAAKPRPAAPEPSVENNDTYGADFAEMLRLAGID